MKLFASLMFFTLFLFPTILSAQAVPPRAQALLMMGDRGPMWPFWSRYEVGGGPIDRSGSDCCCYGERIERRSYEREYEPVRYVAPPPPPKPKRGATVDRAALQAKEFQTWDLYWNWSTVDDKVNIQNGQIVVDRNDAELFRAFLLDSENARLLYKEFESEDNEAVYVHQDGDVTTKKFRIDGVDASEYVMFLCSKNTSKKLYRCAIEATKIVDSADYIPLFRFQEDDDTFIVRNDTDNMNSVQITKDLFPILEERGESIAPIVKNLKRIPLQMRIGKGYFRFTVMKPMTFREDDHLKIFEDPYTLQVVLKDQKNAKQIFDQMVQSSNLQITTENGATYKTFDAQSSVGGSKQFMTLICFEASGQYGCRLSVDKVSTGNMGIRVYEGKDTSKRTIVVRSDTDYSDVAKPLFSSFKASNLLTIPQGTDKNIGVSVFGGQGFNIP